MPKHQDHAASKKQALRRIEDARNAYSKAQERVGLLRQRLGRAEEKLAHRAERLTDAEALAAEWTHHVEPPVVDDTAVLLPTQETDMVATTPDAVTGVAAVAPPAVADTGVEAATTASTLDPAVTLSEHSSADEEPELKAVAPTRGARRG